jgi:hypothetical protein
MGAIPTNFRQVNVSPQPGGDLQFVYEWDSSTGLASDLKNCRVGEIVNYLGTASQYVFKSPPYNQPDPPIDNPWISSQAATNFLNPPYSHLGFADHHLAPPFRTPPYAPDDFVAYQTYRFQCTYYKNNAWTDIIGPISIEKAVSQNSNGTWKYTVTKAGASNSINPLP